MGKNNVNFTILHAPAGAFPHRPRRISLRNKLQIQPPKDTSYTQYPGCSRCNLCISLGTYSSDTSYGNDRGCERSNLSFSSHKFKHKLLDANARPTLRTGGVAKQRCNLFGGLTVSETAYKSLY